MRKYRSIRWVRKGDCFICTSHKPNSDRYVQIMRNGKFNLLHRIICQRNYPEMGSLVARHLCGNPSCIRPDHIVPGTHKQNEQDKIIHGTMPMGEKSYNHKLTAKQVRIIKLLPNSGVQLAHICKVSPNTIWCIRHGKTWKSIK